MNKRTKAIITVIFTAITTAALDWAYAKIETHLLNIPIVTPIGVVEQQVSVSQRKGRISGYQYNERIQTDVSRKNQN